MLHCDCDIAKYVLFEACNATVNLEKREIEEVCYFVRYQRTVRIQTRYDPW